ncbi:MAG: L-histidine N(alpha)-methyltransferase [Candidatus Pacearchaeota archaeon]
MGKINDLIFKQLLTRGYSLEGKTRIWNLADSKLWYITPNQAQGFLDLEKSEDYQKEVIQKETCLIKKYMPKILEVIGNKPINIVDLGCGDGKKAVIFIETLKGKVKIRYCPIDISDYMVKKAISRIKEIDAGEVVEFQWNISDFSENLENINSLLKSKEFKKNFLLLLGNTLGNFEIHELLYEISSSIDKGDVVLIGNGLDNRNVADILKSYDNKYLNNFLIGLIIQVGLEPEDVEFGARFVNSRVEMFYTLKRDKNITFLDKTVHFNKGDQIIACISYKYKKEILKKYLKMYFDKVEIFTPEDDSYALALCQK